MQSYEREEIAMNPSEFPQFPLNSEDKILCFDEAKKTWYEIKGNVVSLGTIKLINDRPAHISAVGIKTFPPKDTRLKEGKNLRIEIRNGDIDDVVERDYQEFSQSQHE